MSEKIYAWLLQLYPSQFREAYGGEALQLFRDRVRDEKGFFSCLRLWLDLIVDLAIHPREYGYAKLHLRRFSSTALNNVLYFTFLKADHPSWSDAFRKRIVVSCLAIFWISLSHVGNYVD